MIKIFTVYQDAVDFCDVQNLKYGNNYTACHPNSLGDKWTVQILIKDYCQLTSDEQFGFVYKLPQDWFINEI